MASKYFDKIEERISPDSKVFASKTYDIIEQIVELLENRNLNRKDLAELIGKRESEISRWMSGTHNLTIRSISRIEAALGEDIIITPKSIEKAKVTKQSGYKTGAVFCPISNGTVHQTVKGGNTSFLVWTKSTGEWKNAVPVRKQSIRTAKVSLS